MAALVAFWTGELSWIERLCIASMNRYGGRLTIYAYAKDAPGLRAAGYSVHSAEDVLKLTGDLPEIMRERPSIIADIIRLELLAGGDCTWIDLDVLLVRPLPELPPLMISYENPDRRMINTSVLRIPARHPLLDAMRKFAAARPVMAPWWRGKRYWKHRARLALGRPIAPQQCQWGLFGPKALTYFAGVEGLTGEVLSHELFHPVPFERCIDLITPPEVAQGCITGATIGVHLWANRLRRLTAGMQEPPEGSWLSAHARALAE